MPVDTTHTFACSCGESHDIPAPLAAYIVGTPKLIVHTPWGSWYVPRVYATVHRPDAVDVPDLAARYGWRQQIGKRGR